MLFPTTVFAVFFCIVFFVFWGTADKPRLRKPLLLAASCFFYGFWSWKFLFLLLGSAVINHWFAKMMYATDDAKKRKRLVTLALVINFGTLGIFKYTKFVTFGIFMPIISSIYLKFGGDITALQVFTEDVLAPYLGKIVLPVGISFFTFQALSYVIDVYRKKLEPAKTTLDFANYLAFFPQLVAGPIVRAADLLPQMEAMPRRNINLNTIRACSLILIGLFKKMIIANWLSANMADGMFNDPADFASLDIILGVYAYAIQIYCDFSAYSDIAIGTALLFGFHFPINFNAPYFSASLQEFWRRWHMSLSSWLKDYLYIPLGGSRKGPTRTSVNLFLTFLLGGIWHGAGWTFIIWGAYHGAYLTIERIFRAIFKIPRDYKPSPLMRIISMIWLFQVVCVSWVFFRAEDMERVGQIFSGIFNWTSGAEFVTVQGILVLVVGFLIQFVDGDRVTNAMARVSERVPAVVVGVVTAIVLALILGLAPQGVMPFIYFDF